MEGCKLCISEPLFSFHLKRLRWIGKNSEGYRLLHRPCKSYKLKPVKRTTILEFFFFTIHLTLGYQRFFSVDNVYFSNYDARVNRELFEAAPLLILSLFRRRKVGQLFSQALIWKKKKQPKRFTRFVLLIYDIAYSKFTW